MPNGFIRARGESAWEVVVYAGRDPVTGKERRIYRTVRGTKAEATRVRNRLLTEVEDGRHARTSDTVGALLDHWFETVKGDLSPGSAPETRRKIDRYLMPRLGSVNLRKLRTPDIDKFYAGLRHQGVCSPSCPRKATDHTHALAPSTVRRIHVVLRRALECGVRWGWLADNPAAHASPGRVEKTAVRSPEPADVRRLLEYLEGRDPDLAAFVTVVAATGARRGEVCALRWAAVELDAGTVLIARNIVQGVEGLVDKDTKTHQARRLAIAGTTVDVLRTHRRRCAERALACGVTLAPDAYLFSFDPAGREPWRPDGVTARFTRARIAAGVPDVTLRDLRHFVATRLIAARVDPRTVSGRLGHRRTSTTLDIYSEFVPEADREAAEVLQRLLEQAT